MLYYLSNLLTYITGHPLPTTSFLTKYQFLYPRMLYKLQESDSIFCEFQHTNMLINYGFSSINFFCINSVFFFGQGIWKGGGKLSSPYVHIILNPWKDLQGYSNIDQIVHSSQALHPENHFRVLN